MQLAARLTLAEARQTLAALQDAVARVPPGTAFDLDASALADFDTSAIAVLLEARRAAVGRGLPFRLQAPPPKLLQLAELYGVRELLVGPPPTVVAPPAGRGDPPRAPAAEPAGPAGPPRRV